MLSLERIQGMIDSSLRGESPSTSSRLFVFAGFPVDEIELPCPHLFAEGNLLLSSFLDQGVRRRMVSSALAAGEEQGDFWCLLEEYLLVGSQILDEYFQVRHLKLPFLNNLIPLGLSIENVQRSSRREEEDCASETALPLFFDDEVCRFLEGKISHLLVAGKGYFFVPAIVPTWTVVRLPEVVHRDRMGEPDIVFTITEDESSWARIYAHFRDGVPDGLCVGFFVSNEFLRPTYDSLVQALETCSENTFVMLNEEVPAPREHRRDIEGILQRKWGVQSFRRFPVYKNVRNAGTIHVELAGQDEVINDILTQVDRAKNDQPYRDVFVTAPTGAGKSLMFQIPAIVLHEAGLLTLVVSPLIALMNDQVGSLRDKGVEIAATINSSISLAEREEIIAKVRDGQVSVVYLSPESLLSRSDIADLIGTRIIGLLVVDEAHIVTTWGKAFRPDYWYLGNYVQRLRKDQKFPIATFTATAIYKGPEDMYSETRDSLGMRDPITYFGYIPRKNISVSFERSYSHHEAANREYNELKFSILAARLREFKEERKKVLVYFPFVSLIGDFSTFLSSRETGVELDEVSQYHGSMQSSDKHLSYESFKSNTTRIMLATKAFGMGVDLPDIDVIYHFAPTGNVCDYIQEIGRAARDERITGLAKFDFLKKDFSFVQRLYGISAIRTSQLIGVMRKIHEIGRACGMKRNLLISSDDFQLVFSEGNRMSERDENLDNKVKTALLVIEKDFILKVGYSPIVARPRALFTYCYFKARDDLAATNARVVFGSFLEDVDGYFKVNLKGFWEARYPERSFARMKYELYSEPNKFGFNNGNELTPIIVVETQAPTEPALTDRDALITLVIGICDEWRQRGNYFKDGDVVEYLMARIPGLLAMKAAAISETILNFLDAWNRSIVLNQGRFLAFREELGYRVIGAGYQDIRDFYVRSSLNGFGKVLVENTREQKLWNAKLFALLGLFDAAGIMTYTMKGGENPEIFIRVNSYYHIQNTIRDPQRYENIILENVRKRHENSVAFLNYIFERIGENTERFWALIESYFLGLQPDLEADINQELIAIEGRPDV